MLRKRILNSHLPQTLKRICELNGSQDLSQSNNTEDFAQINAFQLVRSQISDISFQINVQTARLNFLNEQLEQQFRNIDVPNRNTNAIRQFIMQKMFQQDKKILKQKWWW
ncbi:Hypothetical_protein [Hexamita inflata]|uniref:Hypothetical_protein n=1 Tax=Hexamita inflata TaxID=28002 RepID=A0AA86TY43_9EUKA|nr:Hypothetical protein HINF_LOCUS21675 [Hexamita inflata]